MLEWFLVVVLAFVLSFGIVLLAKGRITDSGGVFYLAGFVTLSVMAVIGIIQLLTSTNQVVYELDTNEYMHCEPSGDTNLTCSVSDSKENVE